MEKENINTENTINLAKGIYIPEDLPSGALVTVEEWAKRPDPTTAKCVVLITDVCALVINKDDLNGGFNFDGAQKAAAELGEGWRCPTRHEAIEMYDARFYGLDAALKLLGGTALDKNGWRWTCEQDPDPEYSSNCAFIYGGNHGFVDGNVRYYTGSVRPVSAFQITV